jgi:glycine reductase
VPWAASIKDLSRATIALVTEGGCVPKGNPDKIESGWATKWAKYSIKGLSRLSSEGYECVHGGFDTTLANEDPNRMVPLDVMVQMEKEGVIAKLHDHYYATVGGMGGIFTMKRFAAEMAKDLKAAHVDGVILTAT